MICLSVDKAQIYTFWSLLLTGHGARTGGRATKSDRRRLRIRLRPPTHMPHKTLSTTGKTENTDRQGCEKKGRQTLSTFCLDFGWIRGDGIEGLQRAGWIEASQRAKNARKGA